MEYLGLSILDIYEEIYCSKTNFYTKDCTLCVMWFEIVIEPFCKISISPKQLAPKRKHIKKIGGNYNKWQQYDRMRYGHQGKNKQTKRHT